MDLINWSLSAIDTIFSTRSLGSGEPVCPDGTFAAGYTRDVYIREQLSKVSQRLPVLVEAVGRAVSIETETINRNMDSITMKLTALQVKIDAFGDQNGQNGQRE